jgi:gamma-glutamyltranspeptidase
MPIPGTTLRSYRPLIQETNGVVVSSHPNASMTGLDILRRGGNAIDAGVAVGLALNVVHAHECHFLGVAPTMMYLADRKEVTTIDGLGVWPKAASIEHFQRHHQGQLPSGILRALAPGKRPRLTPAPALVLKDGQPVIALGGYGGDHIPQGTLQVFLNVVEFGLDPQEAVEEPRFYSYSFPNSSYPSAYQPGLMRAEGRIAPEVLEALRQRGHKVERYPDWWEGSCLYGVIIRHPETGVLQGGADPRGEAYAVGY